MAIELDVLARRNDASQLLMRHQYRVCSCVLMDRLDSGALKGYATFEGIATMVGQMKCSPEISEKMILHIS